MRATALPMHIFDRYSCDGEDPFVTVSMPLGIALAPEPFFFDEWSVVTARKRASAFVMQLH